mmetsp:Transcript_11083/g.25186  ORF Transcript_11083/g.25186 Transcript_11083/m.25186 type:complete len:200 (+) Transcript_11083:367-966(+)
MLLSNPGVLLGAELRLLQHRVNCQLVEHVGYHVVEVVLTDEPVAIEVKEPEHCRNPNWIGVPGGFHRGCQPLGEVDLASARSIHLVYQLLNLSANLLSESLRGSLAAQSFAAPAGPALAECASGSRRGSPPVRCSGSQSLTHAPRHVAQEFFAQGLVDIVRINAARHVAVKGKELFNGGHEVRVRLGPGDHGDQSCLLQ